MPSKIPTSLLIPSLPLAGRQKELERLEEYHARRRNVLILGEAGVGKSALVRHLEKPLSLVVSHRSEKLTEICADLEQELGIADSGARLPERKQRLRQAVAASGRVVVFDGMAWTTPKLSSFIESIMERVPVWICSRFEHSWEIGHFWTLLARFERIELKRLSMNETRELAESAVERGLVPAEVLRVIDWFQRASGGNPRILLGLLETLNTRHYDLENPLALQRLYLDWRINQVCQRTPGYER